MEEDFYSKIELAKTKKNLSEFTKFLNRDLAFQKFLEKETEFLNSELEYERLYSSSFMMSISNDISAKKIISEFARGGKYEILDVS